MKKVYDEAVKQMGNEQEVRGAPHPGATEDEAKAVLARSRRARFRRARRQKSKDPGAAAEGGDSVFRQGADGAGIRRDGFKLDRSGVRSGEDAVRLAHHQGRDKRTKPVPEFDKVKEQIETYVTRKRKRLHPQAPGNRQDRRLYKK